MKLPKYFRLNSSVAFPLLTLIVCLLITYQVFYTANIEVKQKTQAYFDFRVREATNLINQRMQAYEQVLHGAAGIFTASKSVERHEFKQYLATLDLAKNYAGVQDVGFSLIVPSSKKTQHTASIRSEGFPEYTIRPEGQRDIYTSIIYLEPFSDRNQRAFGYDMFSEPVRHAAMQKAIDNGQVTLSGKVKLLQEGGEQGQAGFLMYLPIYRNGTINDTPSERREHIIGWVYSPFRMNDFMDGLFGEYADDLDIQIFEGVGMSNEALMYDSDGINHSVTGLGKTLQFQIADHPWTIHFHPLPMMSSRVETNHPELIATIGTIISVLLSLIIWFLVTGRERALNVAKRMNNDLITERQRLSCIIEGTHVGTWEWNVQTGETSFNDYWANIIGYELSELEPISIESWMKFVHPDDAKLSGALLEKHFSGELAYYECEARMRHKNGHWVWVLDRGKVATWTPDGKPLLMSGTHQEITERKQAEVNLQRESEKNLALLRNASDGIHILDYDGNVVEVSDSFCNMLGYSRDQVIGMNVSSWDAGFVNSDELLMLVRKQFENPVRSQFERLHRRKDGSIFEVEISGYPLELDGHKVLFNSSRDITSRKQIESHLLLHSNILENVAEGVFLIRSADSTIVFSNPQFDQMFGYLKGELIGQHVSVVNAPTEKSPEEVTETINKALRNHGEWHGEVHSRRKDGTVFWTHASVSTFNHSDFGQVWVAVQDDITERKLAENALYIAATAFESQEGMFVTDANSNILRVNQAFTKITGYSAEEVIGKTPRILKSGQHDKDFYITLWESVHNAGGWTGEIWNKRKNGEVYPEFLTITAVKGATGITTNYVATLTDITLRKQAEAAVQQSKEVAEQALTEQSRFLHMLTHELKTPLSVLRMALDIVKPKNSIKLHINLALEDINGIVERSAQMDLLEQRQLVVRPESCDIAAMLSLKKSSSLTPDRFSITLAPLPIVNSDIQLLRIIFSNLINNAIKYSALKTIIEIDAIPSEQQGKLGVLIRIQNQPGASGLPNSEKVFDKYYRSPGAYGMTGSGLGLYLVRSFTELLGGSVACDVVQEKVRFTLWIPC